MSDKLHDKIAAALDAAFDERIGDIRRELAQQLETECRAELESSVQAAREEAARASRGELAQALSAAGRRIRSKESVTEVAVALVDTTAQFCGRSALFIQKADGLLGFRAQGFEGPDLAVRFQQLEVPLSQAAAMRHAVETRDPVVATGSAKDVSATVAELFGLGSDDQVHLFPITLRDKVLAVLYVDGNGPNRAVLEPAIELLKAMTEAWLEAVGTRRKQHETASAS